MIKQVSAVKVDEENGEVISYSVKSYNSKLWKDGKGAILNPGKYANKVYSKTKLFQLIEDERDLINTYMLIEHIYKDTNIIYCRTDGIDSPASIINIANIIGLCPKRTKAYLHRMKNLGVIAELKLVIEQKEYISYVFNPVYVNSCRYINNTLYMLFKPYLDEYFPEWIKDNYNKMNLERN